MQYNIPGKHTCIETNTALFSFNLTHMMKLLLIQLMMMKR